MAKRRWRWWDSTFRAPDGYASVVGTVANTDGRYLSAPGITAYGSSNTVSGTILNADAVVKTDGTARLFVATTTKLYEVTTSSATDRSKSGGTYTTSTEWNAAQYGDVTIYTNYLDAPQASSSGAFADLAGTPPKAKYVCTQSLAVLLANYNDGSNTFTDGVWTSDIGDQTTWTPSSSNQASNFRLLQTSGAITGMVPFRGDVLVFKANSFYRLSYVGRPIIWQVQLVAPNIGASGQSAILVCNDVVLFQGNGGWFTYDGTTLTRLAPIGLTPHLTGAQSLFKAASTGGCYFDQISGNAFFKNGGAFHDIASVQMGVGEGFGFFGTFSESVTIGAIIRGSTASMLAATICPSIGGNFLGSYSGGVVSSSGVPYFFSAGAGGTLQTNLLGDPRRYTTWQRITPLFCTVGPALGAGTSQTATYSLSGATYDRSDGSDTPVSISAPDYTGSATSKNPRFDLNVTARFLTVTLSVSSGPMEVEDILVDSVDAGSN